MANNVHKWPKMATARQPGCQVDTVPASPEEQEPEQEHWQEREHLSDTTVMKGETSLSPSTSYS